MFDSIKDFLTKQVVAVLEKKHPNLPADVQAKIGDSIASSLNVVADIAAIVVAIRNAPKA
jgi:hypothetical protein